MKNVHGIIASNVLAATVAILAATGSAAANDFYAGKSIILYVGGAAGSGYDAYARAVARHIGNHIPGKPTLVVQNMPGAGSIKATEYLSRVAPKDGTAIALIYPGAIVKPLTDGLAKFRYDPRQLEYLGTVDSGTRLCSTIASSKVKSFEDARKTEAIIAATAPGGSTFDYPVMLNRLTGTKFKVVTGYKGTQEIALAMERGEADGWCGIDVSTHRSVRPTWIPEKKVNPLIQLGLDEHADMTKAGYPSIWKFVTAENKALMELIVSQQVFQRPFVAPAGTAPAQLALLVAAFDKTMNDKAFKAEAAKSKLSLNPRTGQQVKALVMKMFASPPDLIARMNKATAP